MMGEVSRQGSPDDRREELLARLRIVEALLAERPGDPRPAAEAVRALAAAIDAEVETRREAERALLGMTFALDQATFSVMQVDRGGRIVYCNDAACRSLGYDRDELLTMRVAELDAGLASAELDDVCSRTRGGERQRFESKLRRKDGTTFPAEVATSSRALGGEELLFAFSYDLSERQRAVAERSRMEAQLRQQQKIESITTLASGVAHEINNPINIVMNYAELITSRCRDDARLAGFAQEIINESQRIATIVRNLLAFAREEREVQQPTAMAEVVERTLSLMREVLRKSRIDLVTDIEDSVPPVVCRFQQLQQVLMNLLTNSRDALEGPEPTDARKKTIRVAVHRLETAGGTWVRTTVEDNGHGIPVEHAERVFDPFFTTKPRDRGTGLGLSVSHGIVTEHGGQLTLESSPGGLTRFHIDLPAHV
jgi:PAS domain S-box-containing protein